MGWTVGINLIWLLPFTGASAAPKQEKPATPLPALYLIWPGLEQVATNLLGQGVKVEELREEVELDTEATRVDRIAWAADLDQENHLTSLATTTISQTIRAPAGTLVVRTAQERGRLAAYLLEPESEDGLAARNFFDAAIEEGAVFPVRRMRQAVPLLTVPAQALPADRPVNRRVTYDTLHGKDKDDG